MEALLLKEKTVRYYMTFPFTLFFIKLSETLETLQNIQLKQNYMENVGLIIKSDNVVRN